MHHSALPIRQKTGSALVALALLVVTGCSTVPDSEQEGDLDFDARAALADERAEAETPESKRSPVSAPPALEEPMLDFRQAPRTTKRFDIQASNIPLKRFFADLGRTEDVNVIVDPSITGTVSLNMRSVTLDQVLDAIRDLYGYEFERTDYGYRVLPNRIQSRMYKLDYLDVNRSGRSDTTVSGGQISEQGGGNSSSSVATEHNADFWQGMEDTISSLLNDGPDRQVVVNAQSGLLVVRATPREHKVVKRFLDDAELSLQQQVVIEAKVVEVSLKNEFRSGINWSSIGGDLAGEGQEVTTEFEGSPLAGIGNIGGVFSFTFGRSDFSSILQLLSNQGDVQVLSSPRVSTVNNQKAVIKVGTDEFFVTNVSSQQSDNQNDDGNATSPEFTLSPFFSGIILDVTPQISSKQNVILHVRPSVTEVVERTKVINAGGSTFSLPLALSSVRETDSIIRASSGQIVVIGGLLSQKLDQSETGLPWLSRIPGLKYLFGQNRTSKTKSELVILLKPVVYDEDTTVEDIDQVLNRMN